MDDRRQDAQPYREVNDRRPPPQLAVEIFVDLFEMEIVQKGGLVSRRQLVPISNKSTNIFGQSPFRTNRPIFQPVFVVVTFVDLFEMEIVQKRGLVADDCDSLPKFKYSSGQEQP